MADSSDAYNTLIDRFVSDRLKPEEVEQFFLYLEQEKFRERYGSAIDIDLLEKAYMGWSNAEQPNRLYQQILEQAQASQQRPIAHQTDDSFSHQADANQTPVHRFSFLKTAWLRYAAAILLIFGTAAYLWTTNQPSNSGTAQTKPVSLQIDVPSPQSTRAFITMGDGQQIMLDTADNGMLAIEGNIRVIKTADGAITYSGNSTTIQYNTLVNPKGSRVVHITLADGTKVWLNAASSLRYPNAFAEATRNVLVTGEAYFEVAHNALKPFVVANGYTTIQVLGTHFNVNSYPDEDHLQVTLLEGSVRVQHEKAQQILSIGEQAQVKKDGSILLDQHANIEQIMAWRNEMFKFDRTDLRIIMRQIERWYNVEVVYESGVQPQLYNGEISRDVPVSEVLKILQFTGAHFKTEDNKITVMP